MTPLRHMKRTSPLTTSEISLGTFHPLRKPPSPSSPLPRHFLMSSDLVQFLFHIKGGKKQTKLTNMKLFSRKELYSNIPQVRISLSKGSCPCPAVSQSWGFSCHVLSCLQFRAAPNHQRHLKKQKYASQRAAGHAGVVNADGSSGQGHSGAIPLSTRLQAMQSL